MSCDPPSLAVSVQNNLHELWALLNFLLPTVFRDSEAFNKVFDLNVDDADKKQNMIKQLHKILRCVIFTTVGYENIRCEFWENTRKDCTYPHMSDTSLSLPAYLSFEYTQKLILGNGI